MSVIEQLLFAIFGVTLLAASLALSDPHLGIVAALKGDAGAGQYVLQSCSGR